MNPSPETELDFEVIQKKQALLMKQAMLEKVLESDVDALKEKAFTIGRYALWIGGAFVVTYVIFGILFDDDDNESLKNNRQIVVLPGGATTADTIAANTLKPTQKEPYSELMQSIMHHMGSFLLAIAKEKLLELLESMQKQNTNEDFRAEGL